MRPLAILTPFIFSLIFFISTTGVYAQKYRESLHWKHYERSVPFQKSNMPDSVLYYLDKATDYAKTDKSWNLFLWYKNEKSRYLYLIGRPMPAIEVLKDAQNEYRQENDSSMNFNYGYTYGGIGFIYYSLSENDSAIVYFDRMIKHLEHLKVCNPEYYRKNKGMVDYHIADTYVTEMVAYRSLYDKTLEARYFQLAIENARKAWQYYNKEQVANVYPKIIKNYGYLLSLLYPFEAADFLEDSKDMIDPRDLNLYYENIASYYRIIGEYDKAIDFLKLSNKYIESENKTDTRDVISTGGQTVETNLNLIARNYAAMGRADTAIVILTRNIAASSDSVGLSDACDALSHIYLQKNELSAADEYNLQSLAYCNQQTERASYIKYLLLRSSILYSRDMYDETRDILRKIRHSLDVVHSDTLDMMNSLNSDYTLDNNLKLGRIYARLFLKLGKQEDYIQSGNYFTEGLRMANGLSGSLYDKRSLAQISKTIKEYLPYLYEINFRQYTETRDPAYISNLIDAVSNNKSRVVTTALNTRHEHKSATDNAYPQTDTLDVYINRLQSQLLVETDDSIRQILRREKIDAQIEQFHLKFDRDYANANYKPVYFTGTGDKIKETIGNKEMVIDYYLSDTVLYAIGITGKQYVISRQPLPDDFEDTAENLNISVRTGDAGVTETKISDILIQPFEKYLINCKHVTFIPDHYLYHIPFEMLSMSDQNLVNALSVAYSYSPYLFLKSRQETDTRKNNILLVAPSFNSLEKFNPGSSMAYRDVLSDTTIVRNNMLVNLPFAREEVNAVGDLFAKKKLDYRILKNEMASKEDFIAEAPDFSILHIATHGFSSKYEPFKSCLIFSPSSVKDKSDLLIMNELFGLKLKAGLVVLSACKSATGQIVDGEGMLALPSGFISAGVPNVIASLWKVHDEKTKDLMVAFYKHLLEGKTNYAEALRLAKIDCIQKGYLPMDWAGFVLIGN